MFAMMVISIIMSGCALFHADRDEVRTTEATFTQIEVIDFAQDRLKFTAAKGGTRAEYTYDIHDKKLSRHPHHSDDGEKAETVQYVDAFGKVTLETGARNSRLLLTDREGNETALVRAPVQEGLQFTVSPDRSCLLYWMRKDRESRVYLYDVAENTHTLIGNFTGDLNEEAVSWAESGRYVLIQNRYVYQTADGAEVLAIDAVEANWTPGSDALLVIEEADDAPALPPDTEAVYGHRLVKYDVPSGDKAQLFPAQNNNEEAASAAPVLISDELVRDESGKFFSFVTGRVQGDRVVEDRVHVMDVHGGFHHIENEQNLRPAAIEGVTFSPNSTFLSYTVGGLLKVLHIPSQKSKVFDVYTHVQSEDSRFFTYNDNDMWIAGSHEIRRLSEGWEEKVIYRAADEIYDFFVSADGEQLLLIEQDSGEYTLKLVSLLDDHEAEAG